MVNFDKFDIEVQCEELSQNSIEWYDKMMDVIDAMNSEDVLDNCDVVPLSSLRGRAYTMNLGMNL